MSDSSGGGGGGDDLLTVAGVPRQPEWQSSALASALTVLLQLIRPDEPPEERAHRHALERARLEMERARAEHERKVETCRLREDGEAAKLERELARRSAWVITAYAAFVSAAGAVVFFVSGDPDLRSTGLGLIPAGFTGLLGFLAGLKQRR